MSGETVLIVDDEAHIRELVRMYLEQEGLQVVMAGDGEQALAQFQATAPALIVLDLMMPKMDGWDVCRRIRATSDVPIIFLTARDTPDERVAGLQLGADDYVTKPFNPRELAARVRAVLRRTIPSAPPPAAPPEGRGNGSKQRQAGKLVLDSTAREVTLGGQRINLRAKEFDLLMVLSEHMNRVFSRDQLLDRVWGYDFYGQTRTVDVHVAHLREKLKGSGLAIETVWGIGYKLVEIGD